MHHPAAPLFVAAIFSIAMLVGCDLDRPQELPPDLGPTDSGAERSPAPESLDRLSQPFEPFDRSQPQPRPVFHTC